MKRIFSLALIIIGTATILQAQQDTIARRIVLIGDGGELTNGHHPVAEAVRKYIPLDARTTIVYLGDNLYKYGLPDDQAVSFGDARAVLDSQLSIADGTPAQIYMIPGNHDWNDGARGGFDAVIREQLYVDLLQKKNVKFYPEEGCPGPIEVSLGPDVTLIMFDSQWWLHEYEKPEIESDCDCKTKEELTAKIEDIVSRNSKKLIILASHHPFKSNGIHGGFYTLKQHIFPFTDISPNLYIPLPVLGSIYPISRSVFGTPQDLKHPNYQNMINQITGAVKSSPNVVFVAGHDHGLQLLKDSSYNYIISGGGCKTNRVSKSKKTPFVAQMPGFSVMEVSTNKNVTVTFYTVTDSVRVAYHGNLLNFTARKEVIEDSTKRVVDIPNAKFKDSVSISASDKYPPPHGLKKLVIGENYHPEWSTKVNMKVFNIRTEMGGFKILSLGGGKQTKSLRLQDKSGKKWTLRSIDKNPTKAIPEDFRGTIAQDLVQEFNSAAHPYGPLVMPGLSEPLGIVAPHPRLYFVPDDPAFGYYQQLFGNTVCMLEEFDASSDGSDTKSTAKVFDKLLEENDHRADQKAVLRARLLDILVGDFDRHFDQWKWATNDTGKGKLYYPIPRDRDQAFFYSDGLLIKQTSKHLLPFLVGYRNDIPKVNWLGYSSKDFDRLFLTDLGYEEWQEALDEFQTKLTDTVIRAAFHRLPKEVYPINGDRMATKLENRLKALPAAAMKYYRFISRQVNVIGSNQKEYFKVTNQEDGLHVRVYARDKGNDTSFVMYDRTFNPATTYEIRLYGLNDDDLFEIDSTAKSKIKIRIIGGRGNDTFNVKGHVQTLMYDMKVEGNYITPGSRGKNRFSKDPPVNSYSILGFQYNKSRFPQVDIGANSDDGVLVGAGFTRLTHGFRNEPFATSQLFSALYSLNRGSYIFRYSGEFNHVTRNLDLVLRGEFGYPAVENFFGLGNTTKVNADSYGFYRSRYRALELQMLFRHRYGDKLQLVAGPYYYQYWNKIQDNIGRVLGNPSSVHLDSTDVYSRKYYLGGKLGMYFDNRNNKIWPTRGLLWKNEFVAAAGLTKASDNYMRFQSDMRIYASFADPADLVAVMGFGAGKVFNKNFEFFQGVDLGSSPVLHGFRRNRYTGQSAAYGSIELRYKLFNLKSYIFPGPVGLIGFYDIGRVWLAGENSRIWHSAYGGGVYFIPFNQFVMSATMGYAGGEKLFSLTLGTKLNFSF